MREDCRGQKALPAPDAHSDLELEQTLQISGRPSSGQLKAFPNVLGWSSTAGPWCPDLEAGCCLERLSCLPMKQTC